MEPMNGIHNTGDNLRHDKPLHTLRGRTKQSKTGGWSKNYQGRVRNCMKSSGCLYSGRGVYYEIPV